MIKINKDMIEKRSKFWFLKNPFGMFLAFIVIMALLLWPESASSQTIVKTKIRDKPTESTLSSDNYLVLDRSDYGLYHKVAIGAFADYIIENNTGDLTYDGSRTVSNTDLAAYGSVIGGDNITAFLDNYFFKAAPPIANISTEGSATIEMGSSTYRQVNWTVTQRTNPIATIVVNGGSVSGSSGQQAVTLTANITNTISITVTDSQGLSDSDNCSFYYKNGYYWGSMADVSSISDADIKALNGAAVGTGKVLTTTRVRSFNGIDAEGNYLVFAFPQSWGSPIFIVANLPNTAFTRVRNDNYINQYGYSVPYQVWVSNTKYNAAVSNFEIQ